MGGFLAAATSFPTAIFSTLLGVVTIYWLLAVIGIVDIEGHHGLFEGHHGLHADASPGDGDLASLTGIVGALGLQGVPLSVAVSALVLFAWTLSCLGGMWLLPLLPEGVSGVAAGAILGIASLSIAAPLASQAVRPLRRLFVTHAAPNNVSLVGQQCKVITGSVDEKVGRAEVPRLGTSLNIRVWATAPNALHRGSLA